MSLSAGLTPPSPRVTSELLTPDPRPSALRYRDYRNALDYNFSEQFWILLAIRLAFLILFEVGRNGGRGWGVQPAPTLLPASTPAGWTPQSAPAPSASTWPC